MAKLNVIAEPGKQEISYTRTFDAPRDLVYKIYTDPTLIPQWWGPRYLTTHVEKMEVRPGGIWRYVQYDPQGNEFGFHGVYHSLTPSEEIINTFEFEGAPGHVTLETVKFEEVDGKTTLIGQSVFQSVADRDEMAEAGAEGGMIESMDRLEEIRARVSA